MEILTIGIISAVLLASICFAALRAVHYARQNKSLKERAVLIEKLMDGVDIAQGLEKNLSFMLRLFCPILNAQTYSFYIYDAKSNNFVIKTMRHMDETSQETVGPNYSGLIEYRGKDVYIPPVSQSPTHVPVKTALLNENDIPVVIVPIPSGKGLIHIAPVRQLDDQTRQYFDYLAERINNTLDICLEMERLYNQVETVVASGKAVSNVSQVILDDQVLFQSMFNLCVGILGANGSILFGKEMNGKYYIKHISSVEPEIYQLLSEDQDFPRFLFELTAENEIRVLSKGQAEFYKLPSYMAMIGVDGFWAARVGRESSHLAFFWCKDAEEMEAKKKHRLAALQIMTQRIAEVLNSAVRIRVMAQAYLEPLRNLVEMMDGLTPYTVSQSELTSRFAIAIAKQMGLEEEILRDVGIAAYLSNIGVLGLSDQLFSKIGKYTELEFEIMKLHAEVGAALIEVTLASPRIASFVHYHHERMDGYGYPTGMRGEDIPLGARIVAAAQFFVAKISGRLKRDPLAIDRAVELLEAAAGTQLDRKVVAALGLWLKKRRLATKDKNCSLGPCWEMRCAPENICSSCPAFHDEETPCWEHKDVQCALHGNECHTCFVRTEYLARKQLFTGNATDSKKVV